jgi:hypothetical protein
VSSNLETRIAAAMASEDTASAALSKLLAEMDDALAESDKAIDTARAKALDPVQSPDPKAARETIAAVEFAAARLKSLKPRLSERYVLVRHAEELLLWGRRYDKLEPQRDALAEELANLYREFSLRPWRKAATTCVCAAATPACMNPTTGIAGCCARAASGHAAAAPPRSAMNSRRPMQNVI